MVTQLRPAFVMMILFVALTGLAYPLAITGAAQLAMPWRASGGLIEKDGRTIGSHLIGQNFTEARYFHPRPSATSAPDPADASRTVDAPYNAGSSSGSNLGPTSQKLIDRVKGDIAVLREEGITGSLSADSVTTSASGLDPHISPENAFAQIPRVAKARGLSVDRVRSATVSHIEGRDFGIFGEPRVNVLTLNLALDAIRP